MTRSKTPSVRSMGSIKLNFLDLRRGCDHYVCNTCDKTNPIGLHDVDVEDEHLEDWEDD